MIGSGGFHGLLRNVRVSPWTRRSLTASLIGRAVAREAQKQTRPPRASPLSPRAALTFRAWEASISAMLHRSATPEKDRLG